MDCKSSNIDLPYSVIHESTPNLGTKLSVLVEAIFMSIPNLSMMPWVELNENDKIQEVVWKCKICGPVCKSRKELE